MPTKDPMRRYTVLITATNGGTPREQHVDAAYWQFGLTIDSSETRDNLIVFKDQDGKPVFAVRGDLVETITEIREPQPAPVPVTMSATGNAQWCVCAPMTGGLVVHQPGCPLLEPRREPRAAQYTVGGLGPAPTPFDTEARTIAEAQSARDGS